MQSEQPKSSPSVPCALWPVDLKLTHLDWNPEATLIHFQGQYISICELDYNILQGEIQNIPKTKAAVDIGEFCLVEDLTSGRWYRGRLQKRKEDLFDVFLIDHGNVLSVDIIHISSCSNDLFILPPKIVCGFLANVLLLHGCSHSVVDAYFSNLIGRNVTGNIQAFLPHKVLLLEAPDINVDLVRHGFGRHMDKDTFILLVEMLTEVPIKQNKEPVPDLLIEKPSGQEVFFNQSGLQGYDILSFCGPRLSCGTRAKVRVTAAVNPGRFYCQMTSMETDLLEMSKKLAAANECQSKEHNQTTPENLGLLCSVKSKDGKWCRGFVQFLPVNSQLRVLLIDYGFFDSVKVENVHSLPPEFLSIPIMAFPCSLASLSNQDQVIKTQQLSFLKAGLLGKVLDVEIKSFDQEQHMYSISVIGAEDNRVKEPEPMQAHPRMKIESVFDTAELSPEGGYLYNETIMGEALGKTLDAEEVHVGSVFVGYVEHVQNPNRFWMRTQKRNDEFEEMMKKLADYYNQVKLEEDVLVKPELGTLCCAVYEKDMHFYRGIVTDTLKHGAEVLFMDFGNIEKVPHMLIKKIPETFASKSAFAFCCTLVNVVPLDEVWTSANSDFFRQAVSNKALLVHVVQKRKNTFVVDLYEMGRDTDQSITELLITCKKAEYWNNIAIKPVVQNNIDLTKETTRPRCSVTSDINGNAEQMKDWEKEEKTCKNQTEKAQASASFKALRIKPGCNFAVRCSCIKSPLDFWCQPLDTVPALEELMDEVNQYYSTHTVPLQSGDQCCVTKSPIDGRWYRAFIIEKQKGYARVKMVDYGVTSQISEHNIQAIMPEFVHLEGQGFRCSLSNLIRPADPKNSGYWSPMICKWLKDFVLDRPSGLRCKVVFQFNVKHRGLCNAVELYNTQTQQSLTDLLSEHGLTREGTILTKQQLTVFPESFVYSSFNLSPGNEEQVYITHVSSQWEVYCHLERNVESFQDLERKISDEGAKMIQASTRAVLRKLCLAKYFDGQWYRGVAHPVQSPLHLSVLFVDYGNNNISEKTNVMFIHEDSDLLSTPMQALKFCLASVSKEELYADVKEWLDGAILNKQVRAVIVGENEDGSFDVELFDGDVNINEKVKEIILSVSPKPKTKNKILHTKSSIKCKSRHKGKSSNSPTLKTRCTQIGFAPHKKKEKTKNYVHGKAQKNTKLNQQKEYRDTNSEQPQNTDTESPQLLCLPDMKVSAGFKAKCYVSYFDSVKGFFLQLSEDEPAILQMAEDLNTSVLRDSLKTTTVLRINDLVLAEYEEDGALYRSAVKDCRGSSSYEVEFVDYGNSAVIGKEKIYSIPKEYLSQPRFGISCSLLDTSTYENDASFIDAVMEKPLMVDFVRHNEVHWEVMVALFEDATLEAAVENGTETKKEEKSGSAEIEEKVRSCEQVSKIERTSIDGENAERTLDGENLLLEPTPATLSNKLEEHRKSPTRNHKTKSDCADAIIHPTIQAKDTEIVTILSVLSNSHFYARLNKAGELLAALESSIDDNLYKCQIAPEENVTQGYKCLVQGDKDKGWHRAIVQNVGQGKCQVLLVDQGITEEIPSDSIRRQCSKLTNIPDLAFLCRVNCLGFSEGDGAHELWCETLKPLIGKEVKLMFVCYSEDDKLWNVEIIVNGQFLVRQHTTTLQQDKGVLVLPAETKVEGSNLDRSATQQLVFAPIEIDKAYSGFAAAVTTPFEFTVVLEDRLLVMNKVSIMLDALPEQMSPVPEAHLVPGTCCLLKSVTKNKWCRAEIIHVDTTAVLNLVDYGHCECISYEDCSKLKRLPEDISNLPKVTYPCILRGVGVDGQWTDEAAVFFQQCLYQKSLQIVFREFVSNTHWKVDILVDGVHVAKELVEAGHANYMDIMLGLRFQEQSSDKAAPHSPDSDEECGQEDEDGKSDLSVDSSDEEEEGKVPLGVVSESKRCFLM